MLLGTLFLLTGASTATAPAVNEPAVAKTLLAEEEQLFYALQLDGLTLSDGLTAYGEPERPLLPVGELCRLLDIELDLDLAAGRLTGRIGEGATPVAIDFLSRSGLIGGRRLIIAEQDFAIGTSELYLSADLLSEFIPARFLVDPEALTVTIEPSGKLPIQSRMERLARIRELGAASNTAEQITRVETPYVLFSPPAVDMAVQVGRDRTVDRLTTRYDLRAAGDLGYAGFQGYLGSDGRGKPSEARFSLERRSAGGTLLGPIGATRVSGGDVFSAALPLGPRSVGGRGISLTTAPLAQASVFDTVDLRGELPIGYDVELYINDVLRSGQREASQGRYEFLDVPLVSGLNVIRIVSYGPRGDRTEAVRVINVGGGQLQRGQTVFDFSAVEAGRDLIELGGGSSDDLGQGRRVAASVSHGLTEAVTITGGVADYASETGGRRQLAAAGVRTAVAGFAVQGDAAVDRDGGAAASVAIAGQVVSASVVARQVEYRGRFLDETGDLSSSGARSRRQTEITIDASVLRLNEKVVPLSLRAIRVEDVFGADTLLLGARASVTYGSVLLSGGTDYEHRSGPASGSDRLSGVFAASTFLELKWQLRAALDYGLLPAATLSALTFTADRSLNDRLSVRFGLASIFDRPSSTNLQLGANWRLPFGDLAAQADYETSSGALSFGLRFAIGLAYDPLQARYRATPPGAADGGIIVFEAFLDRNGNGVRDTAEQGVADVRVEGAERPTFTGKNGRAFFVGAGNAPAARLSIDTDKVDALYTTTADKQVEHAPRPGKTLALAYPIVPLGEVAVRVVTEQAGVPVGISAVRLRLVRGGAAPIEATSEFDGTIIFDGVPAGRYRVELDPEQAGRLGMSLPTVVQIDFDPQGPLAVDQIVAISFTRTAGGQVQ